MALFLIDRRDIKLDAIEGVGSDISSLIFSLLKSIGTNFSSFSSRKPEIL